MSTTESLIDIVLIRGSGGGGSSSGSILPNGKLNGAKSISSSPNSTFYGMVLEVGEVEDEDESLNDNNAASPRSSPARSSTSKTHPPRGSPEQQPRRRRKHHSKRHGVDATTTASAYRTSKTSPDDHTIITILSSVLPSIRQDNSSISGSSGSSSTSSLSQSQFGKREPSPSPGSGSGDGNSPNQTFHSDRVRVIVTHVDEESEARETGVREGDEIVALFGDAFSSVEQLCRAIEFSSRVDLKLKRIETAFDKHRRLKIERLEGIIRELTKRCDDSTSVAESPRKSVSETNVEMRETTQTTSPVCNGSEFIPSLNRQTFDHPSSGMEPHRASVMHVSQRSQLHATQSSRKRTSSFESSHSSHPSRESTLRPALSSRVIQTSTPNDSPHTPSRDEHSRSTGDGSYRLSSSSSHDRMTPNQRQLRRFRKKYPRIATTPENESHSNVASSSQRSPSRDRTSRSNEQTPRDDSALREDPVQNTASQDDVPTSISVQNPSMTTTTTTTTSDIPSKISTDANSSSSSSPHSSTPEPPSRTQIYKRKPVTPIQQNDLPPPWKRVKVTHPFSDNYHHYYIHGETGVKVCLPRLMPRILELVKENRTTIQDAVRMAKQEDAEERVLLQGVHKTTIDSNSNQTTTHDDGNVKPALQKKVQQSKFKLRPQDKKKGWKKEGHWFVHEWSGVRINDRRIIVKLFETLEEGKLSVEEAYESVRGSVLVHPPPKKGKKKKKKMKKKNFAKKQKNFQRR